MHPINPALGLGICMAIALLPMATQASIIQQIIVAYDGDPSTFLDPSEVQDDDRIEGNTSTEINQDLSASISGSVFEASGSVGRFGSYGVSGSQSSQGELRTQVVIQDDDIRNITGIQQGVATSFVIDGGLFELAYAPDATLEYRLTISRDGLVRFQTVGVLSNASVSGAPTGQVTSFQASGTDIGATFDGVRTVEIPLSFQTADLGLLLPNETMNLEYQMDIVTNVPYYAEYLSFKFEDPLTLPGFPQDPLRPTLTFTPAAAPAPAPLFYLVPALLFAAYARRSSTGRRVG